MPAEDTPAPGLRHVTHELRTRIAAATAAVDGLRDTTVAWTDDDRRDLLAVAQTSLEQVRLLLSELSAVGSGLGLVPMPPAGETPLAPLLAAAVVDLGAGVRPPRTHLPASLPAVRANPLVLRVVLASVLRSALREPGTRRLDIRAAIRGERVLLRVGHEAPATVGWRRHGTPEGGQVDRQTPLGPDVSVARDLVRWFGGTLRAVDDERDGRRAVVLELAAVPVAVAGQPEEPSQGA